jgi:hypothetical protein
MSQGYPAPDAPNNGMQRARKDHRGVDLISDMLPFGRLCYAGPNATSNAIGLRKLFQPLTRMP